MRTASRVVRLAVLFGAVLIGVLAIASPAFAISSADQEAIGHLRQLFSIQPSQASDEELARVLDSPGIGPSVHGELECAELGVEALHDGERDRAIAEALSSEIQLIIPSDPLAESVLAVLTERIPSPIGFLIEVRQELVGFSSKVNAFASAIAGEINQQTYRELLLIVENLIEEGMTPEEAGTTVINDYGPLLHAAHQLSHVPESTLLEQDEFTATCMSFAQSGTERSGYGFYVTELVADMRSYTEHGGTTAGGLTIVETEPHVLEVVNNGRARVEAISFEASSHQVGRLGALEPAESASVTIEGAEAPEQVVLEVDGIASIKRSYPQELAPMYAGEAEVLPVEGQPLTLELTLSSGPFFATGIEHSLEWEAGDGATSGTTPFTHSYACYGESNAVFTAEAGKQAMSRRVVAKRPPPFTVDWTTNEEGYLATPGVPVTFKADSSIPTNATVTWSFGDGQEASGREVTHTYSSGLEAKATMRVTLPGPTCPPLTATHTVVVGRSEEWQYLPTSYASLRLSPHIAGYIVSGPTWVHRGQKLTVPAGVNLKFIRGNGEAGELVVEGTLDVQGAPGAPATFTSPYDDTAGGHCTCGGSDHTPASGDWYGIAIEQGTATMEYAAIRYAGIALDLQGSRADVTVSRSSLTDSGAGLSSAGANTITLRESTFARDGMGVELDCFACTYAPQLLDDTFENDGQGVWARGGSAPRIDGATVVGSSHAVVIEPSAARTLVTNTHASAAYIQVSPGSFPTGASRLAGDLPYVIEGEAKIPAAGEVTIAPGTVLRFAHQTPSEPGMLRVLGTLLSQGTSTAPAVLTSLYDETSGRPCGCVLKPQPPAPGDWTGIQVQEGGDVSLGGTAIRYAATGLDLVTGGGNMQVASSTIASSFVGIGSNAPGTINVESSSFKKDTTGLWLTCSCSSNTTVLNSSFPGVPQGAHLAGEAQMAIHGSAFEPSREAIEATERSFVDAANDWWGSADGPRPTGSGASVSGQVTTQPYCANNGCQQVVLSLSPAGILANGTAKSKATITVTRAGIPQPGARITLSSSDGAEKISRVTDNGDGTYTATVTASYTIGTATITATDASVTPAATATASLLQGTARKVSVKLSPATITAGAAKTAIATITVTAAGVPVAGEQLALTSTDPEETIGPITDNGDGTYTATITPSHTVGSAIITATDKTISPNATGHATLTQKSPTIKVTLKPTTIAADGISKATVTIKVTAGTEPMTGQQIELRSSDPEQLIGPVAETSAGIYKATIRASLNPGTTTITAFDTSVAPAASGSATLTES